MSVTVLCVLLLVGTTVGTVHYVTPEGGTSSFEGSIVRTTVLSAVRPSPGDVVQLLPGTYNIGVNKIGFYNLSGTEDKPITVRGLGRRTVMDGNQQPSFSIIHFSACMEIQHSSHVIIDSLAFVNCWQVGVMVSSSQFVTVQNCFFEGAQFAVYGKHLSTHHILVQGNYWNQDPTGGMWFALPWRESHDFNGTHAFYMGGLFGHGLPYAADITGGVIIRNNRIQNSMHAISGPLLDCIPNIHTRKCIQYNNKNENINFEIYGNIVRQSRDKGVKPNFSGNVRNWWVHHNIFVNAHNCFAFYEDMGGPVYIFSNLCYKNDDEYIPHTGTIPLNVNVTQLEHDHLTLNVLQMNDMGDNPGVIPNWHRMWFDKPFYFFHNTIDQGSRDKAVFGYANQLWHRNNAYIVAQGKGLGWDLFDWNTTNSFDYDALNQPPAPLLVQHKQEAHATVDNNLKAGFVDPLQGNYELKNSSSAIDAGEVLHFGEWSSVYSGKAPDCGAFEGDSWTVGPPYQAIEGAYVDPPRVTGTFFNTTSRSFDVYFSVVTVTAPDAPKSYFIEVGFSGYPTLVQFTGCSIAHTHRLSCSRMAGGFELSQLGTVAVVQLPRSVFVSAATGAAASMWGSIRSPVVGWQQ